MEWADDWTPHRTTTINNNKTRHKTSCRRNHTQNMTDGRTIAMQIVTDQVLRHFRRIRCAARPERTGPGRDRQNIKTMSQLNRLKRFSSNAMRYPLCFFLFFSLEWPFWILGLLLVRVWRTYTSAYHTHTHMHTFAPYDQKRRR